MLKRLSELLAVPLNRVKVQKQPAAGSVDMLVAVGRVNCVVECKSSGVAAAVGITADSSGFGRKKR